ncbi:MAG: hypothetical protein QOI24_2939 [Acidobacteriota bacterium]|jgi:steroid delta-isomerase-like uncharacterized protein|nr:hypothetical protein [Acidobacteriota bacterium]
MSESNKAIVRRLIEEAQEQGNHATIDELLSEDFVDHTPLPGVPGNRDGIHILFDALRSAFPDLRVTISEQIADDTRVVTRKTFNGTHGGSFIGIPASGNRVAFEVVDILALRDGKILEHRVIFDQLSLLQQLGDA